MQQPLLTPPPCPLLHRLPPELRLQIYTHLFNTPTHTSLLLRSTSKLEIISRAKHTPAALLQTCRLIYAEAAPLLYAHTVFRVQIYPEGGFPASASSNPGLLSTDTALGSTATYLPRVRNLEIKACILFAYQMSAVLQLLEVLASAVEGAGAELASLKVNSNLGLSLQWKRLVGERGGREEDGLFGRVLVEMEKGAVERRMLKGPLTEERLARLRR